jgi:hypothetical protein
MNVKDLKPECLTTLGKGSMLNGEKICTYSGNRDHDSHPIRHEDGNGMSGKRPDLLDYGKETGVSILQ